MRGWLVAVDLGRRDEVLLTQGEEATSDDAGEVVQAIIDRITVIAK